MKDEMNVILTMDAGGLLGLESEYQISMQNEKE
jgi:hypothetical protein